MELIETKNKIKLAKNGYKLLKQKQDFLMMEFLSMLSDSKLLRKKLNDKLKAAYSSLAVAESYHSVLELENAALFTREVSGAVVGERNVMGVRLPVLRKAFTVKGVGERGYSILGSSAKIDDTSESFQSALDAVLDIAQTEISLRKLLSEVERTKRRVNVLDYSIIPSLGRKKRDIEFRLDEMERSNFVTLKTLKGILGARA